MEIFKGNQDTTNRTKHKRIFIPVIAIVVILGIFLLSGGSSEASLEDVGGFEKWQQDDFKQTVRTQIGVYPAPAYSASDNYLIAMLGSPEDIANDNMMNVKFIYITQSDNSAVSDWDWLQNATANASSEEEPLYFEATLSYLGVLNSFAGLGDDAPPLFQVSDVEEIQP